MAKLLALVGAGGVVLFAHQHGVFTSDDKATAATTVLTAGTELLVHLSSGIGQLPLVAKVGAMVWGTVVLGCAMSSDHGYTSPIDWLLCPAYVTREPSESAVFITGISRGLGRELATYWCSKGFTVMGSVRNAADKESLIKELGADKIVPVMMDQTKDEMVVAGCAEVVQELEKRGKKLAAVVASAGLTEIAPFELTSIARIHQLFGTNVIGNMHVISNLLPQIRKDEARIVVVGAPDIPIPQYALKSACNGALLAFTRALRTELQKFGNGISVSILQPAATRGGMLMHSVDMIRDNRAAYSEEMKKIYPPAWKMARGTKEDLLKLGFDPVWATWAFDHAVTSSTPKTRYTTTPPGTVIYFLSFLVPDRLLEKLLYISPFGPGGAEP